MAATKGKRTKPNSCQSSSGTDEAIHVERCVACGEALNRLRHDWVPMLSGRAIHDGCQPAWVRQVAQQSDIKKA